MRDSFSPNHFPFTWVRPTAEAYRGAPAACQREGPAWLRRPARGQTLRRREPGDPRGWCELLLTLAVAASVVFIGAENSHGSGTPQGWRCDGLRRKWIEHGDDQPA